MPKKIVFFVMLFVAFLFFILGSIFTVIGFISKNFDKSRVCTEKVEAVCIDKETTESTDSDGTGSIYQVPVFEYEYDGTTYHASSDFHSSDHDRLYDVGKTYIIQINPDNPLEIMIDGEASFFKVFLNLFSVMGIGMLVIAVVDLIVAFVSPKVLFAK